MQVSFDGIWQRCWGWTVGTSGTHTCRLACKIVTLSTKTSHSAEWPQQGACPCCIILLYSCLMHRSADRNFVQVENWMCVSVISAFAWCTSFACSLVQEQDLWGPQDSWCRSPEGCSVHHVHLEWMAKVMLFGWWSGSQRSLCEKLAKVFQGIVI